MDNEVNELEKRLVDAVAYRAELESEKTCTNRSEDLMMGLEIAIADLADAPTVTVESIEPHPTEAIVMQFSDNFNIDEAKRILRDIESKFPYSTIVAIPDYVTLQSYSKDTLENIISSIGEIIEEL